MPAMTYQDCVECIDIIFARAAEDGGLPVCAAIVDSHGDMVAFGRMDGAPERSVVLSRDKAHTCIYMDRDTHVFRDMMTENGFQLDWFNNPQLTGLPGGLRIVPNSGCVGAIGLSGRSAEDDQVLAQLGVDHLRAKLDG